MSAQMDPDITSDDKLWALLSYIFAPWVSIVVLLMDEMKNRPFIKYHAVQSAALAVVLMIASVLLIGVCLWPFYIIYIIYLAIKAYQGEYVTIPVITDFVRNQGWL